MGIVNTLKDIKTNCANKYKQNEKYKTYLKRYKEYAFKGSKCSSVQQYEAVITRWYHTIEKGLAYVNFRAGFGVRNIELLLSSMENYVMDGYDKDTFFFRTALSTLKVYVDKNKAHGVEKPELEKRIAALGGAPNEMGGIISFVPLKEETVQTLGYREFVENRHSMRHFAKTPVDIESVKNVLELAQHTPSACNRQGWRTIVISDEEKKKQVLANQNGNEGFGQEFDKVLLLTADVRAFNSDRELFQPYIDGGMYAQSVLNALHYYHIASVPLSASLTSSQEDNVRKILNLDKAEVLIMFIGIRKLPKR